MRKSKLSSYIFVQIAIIGYFLFVLAYLGMHMGLRKSWLGTDTAVTFQDRNIAMVVGSYKK